MRHVIRLAPTAAAATNELNGPNHILLGRAWAPAEPASEADSAAYRQQDGFVLGPLGSRQPPNPLFLSACTQICVGTIQWAIRDFTDRATFREKAAMWLQQ